MWFAEDFVGRWFAYGDDWNMANPLFYIRDPLRMCAGCGYVFCVV